MSDRLKITGGPAGARCEVTLNGVPLTSVTGFRVVADVDSVVSVVLTLRPEIEIDVDSDHVEMVEPPA